MKSEALKKYATANGAIAAPAYGDDALKVAMPAIQSTAWALHEGGKAKVVARHGRHSEAVRLTRTPRSWTRPASPPTASAA